MANFKLDLITDQLAAKEMSIARFYMKTEKWIPALNRLKIVVEDYERTVRTKNKRGASFGRRSLGVSEKD